MKIEMKIVLGNETRSGVIEIPDEELKQYDNQMREICIKRYMDGWALGQLELKYRTIGG